jgi:hypothetical protein
VDATQDLPTTDAELEAWDWRAALATIERDIPWLARQTGRKARSVYAYAYGQRGTPVEWLREVAQVISRGGAM